MKSSRELVLEAACGNALRHLQEYIAAGQTTGRFRDPHDIVSQLSGALALCDISPPRLWKLSYLGQTDAGEYRWSVGRYGPRAYLTTDPMTADLIGQLPELVAALYRIRCDEAACSCDDHWKENGHMVECPHAIVDSAFERARIRMPAIERREPDPRDHAAFIRIEGAGAEAGPMGEFFRVIWIDDPAQPTKIVVETSHDITLGPKLAWKMSTKMITGGDRDGAALAQIEFDGAFMKLISFDEMERIGAMIEADGKLGDATP